jgi:lysozyme family protein
MNPLIDTILDQVLSNEGGYVNNPNDAGGATNMGITIPTLSQYLGRKATIVDIYGLTKDQAKEIYTRLYYLTPRFDTLPDAVQPIAVDTGVLHGTRWSIKKMQMICNQTGFGPLDEDGILGPRSQDTITKCYNVMNGWFINALVEERENYYKQRVKDDSSQAQFLQGWMNRAERFRVNVE